MFKFNINSFEELRLCFKEYYLQELYSSGIITFDDYKRYKGVILDRLKIIESEVKNGKNEKNAECSK